MKERIKEVKKLKKVLEEYPESIAFVNVAFIRLNED